MRFFTSKECEDWCRPLGVPLDEKLRPTHGLTQPHRFRCAFPDSFSQLLWFSRCVESALQPRQTCLLWVTDFDIFPANENLHLYYRLRQSYGDMRLLHEAPGHLCLDYEVPDVVTLVHLCMLFGWDVHLIPTFGYGQALVCHDEWVDFGFDNDQQCDETLQELKRAGFQISSCDGV
ncbi:hypothetical protein [Schlesneria paludicola]|uniref:hypothetical protein n=1 Tax=Schlesneria paludicola TaxID=360056 RepID=UPI00029A708F|nr:hypothetical protein [Schlesneria paludicola]